MMNDEKSKDSRESIQKDLTGPLFGQMDDGWLYKQWSMLYATDINTDGNKLDSKNDGFWFKLVHRWRDHFDVWSTKG